MLCLLTCNVLCFSSFTLSPFCLCVAHPCALKTRACLHLALHACAVAALAASPPLPLARTVALPTSPQRRRLHPCTPPTPPLRPQRLRPPPCPRPPTPRPLRTVGTLSVARRPLRTGRPPRLRLPPRLRRRTRLVRPLRPPPLTWTSSEGLTRSMVGCGHCNRSRGLNVITAF